jgi:ribosomal protein L11 methyltransferase
MAAFSPEKEEITPFGKILPIMGALFKVSVPVFDKSEEPAVELLQEMFQTTACVETDLERNTSHVSVFLGRMPDRAKLRGAFRRFSIRKLRHENWAESWKRHFKSIEIGSKLLIKPTWSKRKAKANQAVVTLDPGLSFGTGQHPTTRFCLEQIVAFRRGAQPQSFLDIGTGSGILAIAAAKLGYRPVHGFDLDAAAVRIARANAAKNGVSRKIRLVKKDVSDQKPSEKYDLICANLLADLLLTERKRIVSLLKPEGRLVLAGILKLQFRDVQRAYEGAGLRLVARRGEDEWKSGAFQV